MKVLTISGFLNKDKIKGSVKFIIGVNIVWNGGGFDAVNMSAGAANLLNDFQKFHPLISKKKGKKIVRAGIVPLVVD